MKRHAKKENNSNHIWESSIIRRGTKRIPPPGPVIAPSLPNKKHESYHMIPGSLRFHTFLFSLRHKDRNCYISNILKSPIHYVVKHL
eukprot:Pgem_evm1s2574